MLKTIFVTITATFTAVTLTATLSLNSIIGAFGRTAIPLATLAQLQASQRIVEAMKTRHIRKNNRVTKRFIKRSGRRVASTALAAATFGTVAVAATMTAVEVMDHCEQKAELQDEANILYGTDIEFDFQQCIQESTDNAKAILTEAKATATSRISDAFDMAERYSSHVWSDIKATAQHAIDYTVSSFTDLWNSATSWFTS
jgi:cytochrome c biogenesis factor